MGRHTNLARRGSVYYARVGLPADLIQVRRNVGLARKVEVLRSLGTRDPATAKRLLPNVVARIRQEADRELALLRSWKQGDPLPETRRLRTPTDADLQQAAWEILKSDVEVDQWERLREPTAEGRDAIREAMKAKAIWVQETVDNPKRHVLAFIAETAEDQAQRDRRRMRTEMRDIERAETQRMDGSARDAFGGVASAVIADRGWDITADSPQFGRLCDYIKGARLRALQTFAARDAGDFLSPAADPLRDAPPAPVTDISVARAKRGESLLDLLEIYLKEQAAALSGEEVEKKRKVGLLFAQHVGWSSPPRVIPPKSRDFPSNGESECASRSSPRVRSQGSCRKR